MLGTGKKVAQGDLDDAMKALSKLTSNNPALVTAKQNVTNASEKLVNAKKHLPSDVQSLKNEADKKLKYVATKNQHLPGKAQDQGVIKSLFDPEIQKGKLEIGKERAKNYFATKKYDNKLEKTKNNFSKELSHANADLGLLKDNTGITQAEQKVEDAKKAFDRATRATSSARTVAATGAGLGAYKLNQKKKQNQNLSSYY
ncbi:MAG: hypothetical protein ACRCX2_23165 [Paraclostridium sp.]